QRAFSPHTIRSYRDSLKLLLQFTAGPKRRVADLTITDLMPAKILAFLDYLEQRRGNDAATRNVRLTALHSFFDFLGTGWPAHLSALARDGPTAGTTPHRHRTGSTRTASTVSQPARQSADPLRRPAHPPAARGPNRSAVSRAEKQAHPPA